MAKLKKIELPKKFEYTEGVTNPLYKKYSGWEKISYSQVTSFKDESYRGDYFAKYFAKMQDKGNIFATYGKIVGEFIESDGEMCDEYFSAEDIKILKGIERPVNAVYEFETIIDLEPFGLEKTCMQGFTDRQYEITSKNLVVEDFKTLNLEKKKEFYESDEYNQLLTYGFALEEIGYSIHHAGVIGLGRKGNTMDTTAYSRAGNPLWLRLSGEIEEINSPYNREEAVKFLETVTLTCLEISDYYKLYKKIFEK